MFPRAHSSNFLNGSCFPQGDGDSVHDYFEAHQPRPRRGEPPATLPPWRQRRGASTSPSPPTRPASCLLSSSAARNEFIGDASSAFVETDFAGDCSRAAYAGESRPPPSAQRLRSWCRQVFSALTDPDVRACGYSQLPHLGDGRRLGTDGAAHPQAAPYWRRKSFCSKKSECICVCLSTHCALLRLALTILPKRAERLFALTSFAFPPDPTTTFHE